MSGLKGLAARLFAKQKIAEEFDPEADAPMDDDDKSQKSAGSDSEQEAPEDTHDTEHYVAVGKSKLRQAQPLALGLAYRGKRVSRDQLNQSSDEDEEEEGGEDEEDEEEEDDDNEDDEEEFDDPDNVDIEGAEEVNTDHEIDSDDALGTDDEELVEKFTFRGSSKPKTPKGKPVESEEEEEEEEGDDDDDDEDDDDEMEDGDSNEDTDDDSNSDSDSDSDSDSSDSDSDDVDAATAKAEAETRKLLAQDRQQVLASLSQAAKADADKGFAVRTQRRTFDVLLNMRIRMQKALSVANSLQPLVADVSESAADGEKKVTEATAPTSDDYEKAAEQAIELLHSIQNIRASFYGAGDAASSSSPSAKRKATHDTSCEAIFEQMAATEDAALAKRRKVIDRWSARVQRPSAGGGGGGGGGGASSASRRFLSSGSAPQALTAVLDGQLVTPDRLIRRTRTPRSCAPVQAAKRVEQDAEIFDDADFYQLLLKELVDQRTVDVSTGGGGEGSGSSAPTVRWAAAAAKEAKTRKVVDRKASKGRKMRFNVHEKLQNFMTPEDRRDWEPEAIDRFFSSLFGQRVALQEDDTEDEDDETGGASLGGEGLRLF